MSDPAVVNADTNNVRTWRNSRATAAIVALLLLVHAALAIDVARKFTVTHDEYWHIPVGLLNLKTARFDYDNLNPPLLRMIAALPLAATGAQTGQIADNADPRMVGDAFVEAYAANDAQAYRSKITLARVPIAILSVLTGLMLATWCLQDFGRASAVVVTILWCFSPMVLGCASLVTTDLGAGGLFVAAIWRAWRFARQPTLSNAIWMGFVLGLGPLAKYTCVLAVPFAVTTWWICRFRNADRMRQPLKTTIIHWGAAGLVALFVINAGYFFRGTGTALLDLSFRSQFFTSAKKNLEFVSGVPIPLPVDLIQGIDHQRMMMEGNHPVYLDGVWSEQGRWDYFLKAFAYKVPHAYQLAFFLACVVSCSSGQRDRRRLNFILMLPVVVLLILASGSGMQLGLRYVFPVFPLLFMFVAQTGMVRWRSLAGIAVVIAVAGCVTSVRHHPNHIAYFNEASGGPVGGREHLLDSNIDWGQDLYLLKPYMVANDIDSIQLAYFGMVRPDQLGIEFTIPSPGNLQPGWYAISTNFVKGRPHTIRRPDGEVTHSNIGAYSVFGLLAPKARLGESIDIYNVTSFEIDEARSRMRQTGL